MLIFRGIVYRKDTPISDYRWRVLTFMSPGNNDKYKQDYRSNDKQEYPASRGMKNRQSGKEVV